MPQAIAPDLRSLAQALFMQGFTTAVISQKLTLNPLTIQMWATRGHWVELRDKLATELGKPQEALLQRESVELRKGVALELARVLKDVRAIPGGRKTAGQRASILEGIVRSAKTVLGWGDPQSGKAIDVSALSSALPALASQGQLPPPADGQPTVDEQSMLPGDPGSQGAEPAGRGRV